MLKKTSLCKENTFYKVILDRNKKATELNKVIELTWALAAAPASESGGFGGDSDWQGNLSSWKNRRRKQSEEALQRVAEVKALEDVENSGEPRKM